MRIFNLNGEPIDTIHGSRLSEVRWFNSDLRIGLLMEVIAWVRTDPSV